MNLIFKILTFVSIAVFTSSCFGAKGDKKAVQSATSSESLVCSSETAMATDTGLFEYDGKNFRHSDLSIALQQALYDVEREQYERVKSVVDSAVIDLYVQRESVKQKKSVEEIEKNLVSVAEPTDKQLQDWYEMNKARIPYPFEQIKAEIGRIVKGEEENHKRQALVVKLQREGGFKLHVAAPQSPSADIDYKGYPTKGATDAKVVIVEFSDYQCGHCKAASSVLKGLMEKNKDKVQLVHMAFPLQETGLSFDHALAATCAAEQDKFWDYHYLVFASPNLSAETGRQFAEEVKLDMPKFDSCLTSDAAKQKVRASRAEGDRLGISGTPSIYVNGRKISGYSPETLQTEIDSAFKG